MAVCGKCNAEIEGTAQFCASCGASASFGSGAGPAAEGDAAAASSKDAEDNKLMAILAYIIFFIPLLVGVHKTSPFARFHTNQGTLLFILSFGYGFAVTILSVILGVMKLGFVVSILVILSPLVSLAALVLFIIGIMNAAKGEMKELPIIGKYTIIK